MTLRATFIIITIAIACLACAGCTVQRMTFPNHDPDEVWTVMVAVAQTPDYNHPDYTRRWTVRVNEVWVNPERSQIEIYRRLERVLHRPASPPLHEEREWKFNVAMESTNPPTATFISRSAAIPAHVWDEAQRYFDEVWLVLGGKPLPPPPTPNGQPPVVDEFQPPEPPPQTAPETIDIEELEPRG